LKPGGMPGVAYPGQNSRGVASAPMTVQEPLMPPPAPAPPPPAPAPPPAPEPAPPAPKDPSPRNVVGGGFGGGTGEAADGPGGILAPAQVKANPVPPAVPEVRIALEEPEPEEDKGPPIDAPREFKKACAGLW
jgi:hypothetical protein